MSQETRRPLRRVRHCAAAVPLRAAAAARALALAVITCALLAPAPGRAQPANASEKIEERLNEGLGPAPAGLDRTTPARAWASLRQACAGSRWELAAHLLNLGDLPAADHKTQGPILARQLCESLRAIDAPPVEELDDTPLGPVVQEKPANFVVVARVARDGGEDQAWLRRTLDQASGQHVWVLTPKTVSLIPFWYRTLVKKEQPGRPPVELVNEGLGPNPEGFTLTSPRELLELFIQLTGKGGHAGAARLLDLSAIPRGEQARAGQRLARRLALVLKQLHPAGYGRMSNDPMGAPERDVPFDEEVVANTTIGSAPFQIRLARYPLRRGEPIWLFSAETVAEIDTLYGLHGYGWAGDYLPPVFFEWQLWGIQLWQWIGLAAALALGLLFGLIAAFVAGRLLLRLAKLTRWEWDDEVVGAMRGPLIVAFWVLGFVIAISFLALSPAPRALLSNLNRLVVILAFGWFLVRIIDVAGAQLQRFFKERSDEMGMAMVPVARKVLKPIVFIIVLIFALQNAGMNVGGLLAGLGIGGLAIALAGKSTLENLFGSITIAFDRPFKVGDFVKVGDFLGTVEDVGLRSTRVRTLERTLVTIPNGQMADSKVENYAVRDRLRLLATFGVQYDTSLDQVRYVIDEIKRYLLAHPRVFQESPFAVRFVGYAAYALEIQVICYVTSTDFYEFTGIREQIYMDIGEIIERSGAIFAYPSQTVYVGKDVATDGKKAKQATALVARRKEAGELCLPEIPHSVKEAVWGGNEPLSEVK